jgi:protein TonB
MADRTARSLHRLRLDSDAKPQLKLIAGARDAAPSGTATLLVAPAVAPAVLSPSSDICGVGRLGWAGAAILYAALGGALLIAAWRATPPEPWPTSASVFKVVFEEPPPAPEPPVAEAVPEPPPPPPPMALAEPTPQPLPKPPPAKPAPPRQHAAPPPHAAAPSPAPPAPTPPAEQQVATATMAPPALSSAPVVPPQPISGLAGNRKPDYPAPAMQRGQQGRVVLRVEVSAVGTPLNVAVASTSGYGILDKAAVAAVETWRFRPATQAGTAVTGAVDVPIQFRLEE